MESTEGIKVTVYDILNKKPVLVFSSMTACGAYLTNKTLTNTSAYIKHKILTKAKMTPTKNVFGRSLVIRVAASEQEKLLINDQKFVILDDFYKRNDTITGSFKSKRYEKGE